MNMPNFKDILQKLSVFKNNLPLLMSVIIVLVAVIILVITQLVSGKFKEEIQTKSVKPGERVARELKSAPSSKTLGQEQKHQEEHAKDANEIALLAKQTTTRELLSYDIFLDPNISSTVVFREFGQHYRRAIDNLLVRVRAGDYPTEAEIEKGLEESAVNSRLRRGRSGMMGGLMGRSSPMTGRPMGRSSPRMGRSPMTGRSPSGRPGGASRRTLGRSRMMGELENMIIDEICRERAKSVSVYANPAD